MYTTHDDHLLSICPSERLCPSDLSRVSLHFEVFVTFRRAESKALCVVSDKHGTMAWVDVDRTKVTLFDSHREGELMVCIVALTSAAKESKRAKIYFGIKERKNSQA